MKYLGIQTSGRLARQKGDVMKGCRPLTTEEFNAVLGAFEGRHAIRNRCLFIVGVRTGYRISELLSLRLRDVVPGGRLVERLAVRRCHMKRQIEGRSVILHPQARAALEAWLAELRERGYWSPGDYVFQSGKGRLRNTRLDRRAAWRFLHEAFTRVGLQGPLGTHTMRKTFAARMHAHFGGDLAKVQKALGHLNLNSTVSYCSFAEREIDEAILAW